MNRYRAQRKAEKETDISESSLTFGKKRYDDFVEALSKIVNCGYRGEGERNEASSHHTLGNKEIRLSYTTEGKPKLGSWLRTKELEGWSAEAATNKEKLRGVCEEEQGGRDKMGEEGGIGR